MGVWRVYIIYPRCGFSSFYFTFMVCLRVVDQALHVTFFTLEVIVNTCNHTSELHINQFELNISCIRFDVCAIHTSSSEEDL